MGWFNSREDELLRKNDKLRSELRAAEVQLMLARRELEAARISGAKVRARARALRIEKKRLRALLDRHDISWEHEGVSRGESTST